MHAIGLGLVWVGVLTLLGCGWNGGAQRDAVTLSPAPPPVRGGTLAVSPDGAWLVLLDRDRARVDRIERGDEGLVRTASRRLTSQTRPERAIVVGDETWLVRADGRLVVLDATLASVDEVGACSEPYGLAWDATNARAWISCTTGELVIVGREGARLEVLNRVVLPPDTGDIAIAHGRVFVAHTRLAEVAMLDATTFAVLRTVSLAGSTTVHPEGVRTDAARAALRLVPSASGVRVLHQRARVGPPLVGRTSDRYASAFERGGPCGGLAVQVVVTEIDGEGRIEGSTTLRGLTYASDVAWSADSLAVAAPGSFLDGDTGGARASSAPAEGGCLAPTSLGIEGQVTAVAWLPGEDAATGSFVWQTREPAALFAFEGRLDLDGRSARDTGHDIFHAGGDERVPCIACHLDGGDDGHVWEFTPGAPRRTSSLRLRTPRSGGLVSTAPFHWDGTVADLDALMGIHFPAPSGTSLRPDQVDAFAAWADALPARPAAVGMEPGEAVARGRALFGELGCARCHGAEGLTPQNIDDAWGWQVPSLVELSQRAPYGHAGCGETLADMLTERCGGAAHRVDDLADREDLAAYLRTR